MPKLQKYFRSSEENVKCRITFILISGNILESKCDHHKLNYLLGQSKHCLLEWYHCLFLFSIFFLLPMVWNKIKIHQALLAALVKLFTSMLGNKQIDFCTNFTLAEISKYKVLPLLTQLSNFLSDKTTRSKL